MNKVQIAEVVGMFDLSEAIAKSLVNRLESALGKTGSTSSRLKMASSSVMALSEKCESDSNDEAVVLAIGSFLVIFAEIAIENQPAPSTKANTSAPKTKREIWFDADSPEAIAITTPKPARSKKAQASAEAQYANAPASAEIIQALIQALTTQR